MLTWQTTRCLENSLKFFLDTKISEDNVTDINGDLIPIRIGRKNDDSWTVPCISVYIDSHTNEKIFIGSNQTDDRHLIIVDIYAENEGERMDLSDWMLAKIQDGFRYYTYTVNVNTPFSPTKVSGGWVNFDIVTNTRVILGQNVSIFDQHRHRLSLQSWITG